MNMDKEFLHSLFRNKNSGKNWLNVNPNQSRKCRLGILPNVTGGIDKGKFVISLTGHPSPQPFSDGDCEQQLNIEEAIPLCRLNLSLFSSLNTFSHSSNRLCVWNDLCFCSDSVILQKESNLNISIIEDRYNVRRSLDCTIGSI